MLGVLILPPLQAATDTETVAAVAFTLAWPSA
jgi:hypothetical protein